MHWTLEIHVGLVQLHSIQYVFMYIVVHLSIYLSIYLNIYMCVWSIQEHLFRNIIWSSIKFDVGGGLQTHGSFMPWGLCKRRKQYKKLGWALWTKLIVWRVIYLIYPSILLTPWKHNESLCVLEFASRGCFKNDHFLCNMVQLKMVSYSDFPRESKPGWQWNPSTYPGVELIFPMSP